MCGTAQPHRIGRAAALGQVDLQEAAVAPGETAEGMQGLDHAGPLRPAAARPGRQGDDGHLARGQRRRTAARQCVIGAAGAVAASITSSAAHVFDHGAGRQAVLGQPDAAGPQVGADLLVQLGIETVLLEQLLQLRLAQLFGGRRREKARRKASPRAAQPRMRAAGGGEAVDFARGRPGQLRGCRAAATAARTAHNRPAA